MAEGSPAPAEGRSDAWNAKQMVWAMNNGKEMVKMIDAVVGRYSFTMLIRESALEQRHYY